MRIRLAITLRVNSETITNCLLNQSGLTNWSISEDIILPKPKTEELVEGRLKESYEFGESGKKKHASFFLIAYAHY